jgi:hypothetical protein
MLIKLFFIAGPDPARNETCGPAILIKFYSPESGPVSSQSFSAGRTGAGKIFIGPACLFLLFSANTGTEIF